MYACRVRRLPVVDADGRLVGIISRADVLAAFDRTDEEIREDIDQVISREFRYASRQFTVTVRSGVVTLHGSPESATLGRAMLRKIRHVPGVVAVRDRLGYPPDQAACLPCDRDLRSPPSTHAAAAMGFTCAKWEPNQSPARSVTCSRAPGSENRWVAPPMMASRFSHVSCARARWLRFRITLSAPPTMNRVGVRTSASRPPTRSGRPPRDTMAATGGRGMAVTAARVAAAPVLVPK